MATEVMELAKTLVGSREKTAEWLRLNASTRHGLPWNEDQSTNRATSTERTLVKEVPVPTAPTATAVPQPIAEPKSKIPDWLKTAGLLALSGGSAAGLYSLFNKPETTIIEQPVDPSGSLLQYLEDEGFHVGGSP